MVQQLPVAQVGTRRDGEDGAAPLLIKTPMLAVFLGSTAGLAGIELRQHLFSLGARDQQRVACVFIDTDVLPPLVRA